jgi:putative glycosyltransferase (TIGR04348 family)
VDVPPVFTHAPAPSVVIVTPALAAANNGNWQTARRWQHFLSPLYPTRLVQAWPDAQAAGDTLMIALHARRSAASIAAWHARHGSARLAVVLTGTDLYRDIASDTAAQHSLDLAGTLVVLQALGLQALPAAHREKAQVIVQSAPLRKTLEKTSRHLRALMVGHLRAEKDPHTLFAAARLLKERNDIFIDHIGAALDPALGAAATATMAACPRYRWLGGRAHEETRRRIQRAHVLIHASQMEGGAHVIIEAATSGTPVLAARIDGNVGLLGADYAGYFPCGDAAALADLLRHCRPASADFAVRNTPDLLGALGRQIHERAGHFTPVQECTALRALVAKRMEVVI